MALMSLFIFIFLVFPLLVIGIHWTSSFTISSETDPVLPFQFILNDKIFRTAADNEIITIRCPAGTRLDEISLTCKFLDEVDMPKIDEVGRKRQETCIPGKTKRPVLPVIEDCRSFILCGAAGSFTMKCPGILLFNEKINACDYIKYADCCEYPEKNSSRLLQ